LLRTRQHKLFVWLLMLTTNSGSECWSVRQEANQVVFGHPPQSGSHIDNKIDPKHHPLSCPNIDPKPVVEYWVFPCVLHANQHLLRRGKNVAMGADLRRGKSCSGSLFVRRRSPCFFVVIFGNLGVPNQIYVPCILPQCPFTCPVSTSQADQNQTNNECLQSVRLRSRFLRYIRNFFSLFLRRDRCQ